MNLLLDVGNSRLKWALQHEGSFGDAGALPHHAAPATLVDRLPDATLAHIALANVIGDEHEQHLCQALQRRYGKTPTVARVVADWQGLRVAYKNPQRLGVDRWLMMVALWSQAPTSFAVAAAGTALTFDAVAADGRHLGGFIAAGLVTHLQALLGATRFPTGALPLQFNDDLGRDTDSCVRQGAFLACIGALEHAARKTSTSRLVLSGGDAPLLQPLLPAWELRPQLVLEGLAAWLRGKVGD